MIFALDKLNVRHISTSALVDLLSTDLASVSRDAHLAMIVSTKPEVDTTIRCFVIALLRYNFAAESFYTMKLCSRLFVLYCRSRPKDDKSRHFDPHFEEVRTLMDGSLESLHVPSSC